MEGVSGALSARQAEIARLIASGGSTREIAEMLCLSPRTVETHVAAIFEKLGVHSRVELTAILIRTAGAAGRSDRPRAARASLLVREADVASIAGLLGKHRVVTIVGTGGLGKTQTALRVLEAVEGSFAEGTWVLELGALASGAYVAGAIAHLLGMSLSDTDVLGSLTRQLGGKHALLLFDDCEHLVDDVGEIASAIVKACGGVSILATSREPLRISAERTFRLPALPVRDDGPSPAVDLFVERARALDDTFALSASTTPTVVEICRRLDGVPLAIELAASRIFQFSPAQILARIEDHLEILRSTKQDVPSRHRSMYALIDWSYDTLREGERALFRHASVFAGSFALEGAIAVGSTGGVTENDVVERLASLIDKSLVMVERAGDTMRYRLLDSTRVFARRKATAASEVDATAARHVRFLGDRFAALRALGGGFQPSDLYETFAAELADIRAALESAYARADYEAGAKLLGAIGGCWSSLGLDREGIARNEAYLAVLGDRPIAYALLPVHIGLLFRNSRVGEAAERARDALRAARESGDAGAIATGLQLVAATVQSKDVIGELLLEADRIGHRTAEMDVWYCARRILLDTLTQEFDRAEVRLRDLMDRASRAGDRTFVVNLHLRRSVNEYFRGDLQAAVTSAREAVKAARPFGNVPALAYQLYVLSNCLCLAGDAASAGEAIREALQIAAPIDPHSDDVAVFVEGVAFVRALGGDAAGAARLSGFARAVYARTGAVVSGVRADLRARVEEVLVGSLGADELAALRERGSDLSAAAAIELALS